MGGDDVALVRHGGGVSRLRGAPTIVFLGALGAVLYTTHGHYDGLGLLAFASTAPWAVLLLALDRRTVLRVAVFLVSVYAMGLLCLPWLKDFNLVAWLIAPLFYAPLFGFVVLFGAALRSAWPGVPLSFAWSIAFTAGEYLRVRLSAGEIAFCQLGTSLVGFKDVIQVVDLAGVSVLTFMASLGAGLCADVFVASRLGFREVASKRQVIVGAVILVALVGASLSYGRSRRLGASFSTGPRVLVVQPNFRGWGVRSATAERRFENVLKMTTEALEVDRADLIVWPENSVIPLPPYDKGGRGASQMRQLRALARGTGATVVIDGPTRTQQHQHHAVTVVYPNGYVATYKKRDLVPWSEYTPYVRVLRRIRPAYADGFTRFVQRYSPHLQSFEPGSEPTVFPAPAASWFGAPICYETLSARAIRSWYATFLEAHRQRRFLVNPVNEKLLGSDVHRATLAMVRFRAIEGRTTVVRAANDGISAAIDPNGEVYAVVRGETGALTDVPGTFVAHVLFDRRAGTIYTRLGDWLPWLCIVVSALAVCWVGLRRRFPRRTS